VEAEGATHQEIRVAGTVAGDAQTPKNPELFEKNRLSRPPLGFQRPSGTLQDR